MPIFIASANPQLVVAVHQLIAQQGLSMNAVADCSRVAPLIASGTIRGILYLDIASCSLSLAVLLQTITGNALLLQRVAIVLIGNSGQLPAPVQQQIATLSLPILPFPFVAATFVNLLNTLRPRYP